ncbi:MAG: sugar kinase [Caulobacteraceae bacterium]|nr:sugar kinase [Caulobacteraceae bacterium]
MRAVCIGEAMIELAPAGPGLLRQGVAGDVFNAAVHLRRRLEPADQVAFLTALGEEGWSGALRGEFERRGLDLSLVFTVPGRLPGLYIIELDAAGERTFHYWRSTSAAKLWLAKLQTHGGAQRLAGADLVYLSGISLAILEPGERREALDLLADLRGKVGRIAFDPNVRPQLWGSLEDARRVTEAACSLSDIVLPSEADGELLWGEADPARQAERYRTLGAAEVALTLGARGALVLADGQRHTLPVEPADVVDTSGAGDAFNGGYLAGRLQDESPETAARQGLACAASTVSHKGALPPSSTMEPSLSKP